MSHETQPTVLTKLNSTQILASTNSCHKLVSFRCAHVPLPHACVLSHLCAPVTCVPSLLATDQSIIMAPTARAWFNRGAGAPNGVDEHCLQLSSLDNNSDAGSKLLVSNIERASGAKSSKTCLSQPETTSREARLRKTYNFLSRCSSPEHCFRMAVFITSNFDQTLFLGF